LTADDVTPLWFNGDRHGTTATREAIKYALGEFMRRLCRDATPELAGRRLFLLAYLCDKLDCQTSKELAAELKVSPGRVSQLMGEIPPEFKSLLRLQNRTVNGASARLKLADKAER
jgi:hypothetical protein